MAQTSVQPCPVCGGPLPTRPTGRPPTYCSTTCRQAAHRARQRAEAAARRARAAVDQAAVDLAAIENELAPLRDLLTRARLGAGDGWEDLAVRHAVQLGVRAQALADAALAHARAVADQNPGFRRLQASAPASDET